MAALQAIEDWASCNLTYCPSEILKCLVFPLTSNILIAILVTHSCENSRVVSINLQSSELKKPLHPSVIYSIDANNR